MKRALVQYVPFIAVVPQIAASLSQTIRMIRARSSKSQSLVGWCLSVVTLTLWSWYWTSLPNGKFGLLATLFTLFLAVINVVVVLVYR
jgi:uncharacterized protein with PQ loop repeat